MFEKRKLEKVRAALNHLFVKEFRFGGATVSSGFLKTGVRYTGAYANIKTLNETMLRGLGDRGGFRMDYGIDKTLTLKLTFSCTEGDEDYELVKNHFYEYEEEDFDDLPEDLRPFHDLHLHIDTEDGFTELTYTTKNVALDAAPARADRLLDYVLNVYDVYLENLLEEYGEE